MATIWVETSPEHTQRPLVLPTCRFPTQETERQSAWMQRR
jgi:hypothetical protein